ncbi:MAG: SDR family NAD(P)-dependent oxidoreductase, partial [Casimicrobium sp.]
MELNGKVILITGGASGLGAATARAAAAHGAKVVLADIREEEGRALATELKGEFVKCDVTQESDAKNAVAAAVALGELRGLVNCAGVATGERVVGRE